MKTQREKTLLLGNGLNRTLDSSISWGDLMRHLGSEEPSGADVPYPIAFEQLAAQKGNMIGKRGTDPYKELRSEIKDFISNAEMHPESIHYKFAELPFNHMVTTNYDCVFESIYQNLDDCIPNIGGTRNILGPVFKNDSVDFYHAHGVSRYSKTLCLGYEHYASLIGKIRKSFYPSDAENNDYLEKLIQDASYRTGIWPEYLLTTDVAIVGFEMDYSESDFWWLLALRAALFAPCNGMSNYENRITYYRPRVAESKHQPSVKDDCRFKAMEALGVTVQDVDGDNYKDVYENIVSEIMKEWSV